jgi:hypothetical protein
MKLLKNRVFAIIICALLIVSSIYIGSGGLYKEYKSTITFFTEGSDGDGYGIAYDLEYKVGQAYDLLTVAGRYLDQDDLLMVNLNEAIEEMETALETNDASAAYDANTALNIACDAIDDSLEKKDDLSESDIRYLEEIKDELSSRDQIIGHSDYNDLASAFNAMLSKFPTNLVAKLRGIGEIPLFE